MADYAEQTLVNVSYARIVDRTELETCFDVGKGQPVWLPNAEIQETKEFDQELRIPKWLAEERGLI